jgi:hypothetical protein
MPDFIRSGPYSSYNRRDSSGFGFPRALHDITTILLAFFATPVFVSSNTAGLRTTTSVGASIVWFPFVAL